MNNAAGTQILTLTGLRFDANLGILSHEKEAPQPIQVDAELSLGVQPLQPRDDDILHVLDYRKVRQTDRKFNRMRPSMARVLGLETRSAKEG